MIILKVNGNIIINAFFLIKNFYELSQLKLKFDLEGAKKFLLFINTSNLSEVYFYHFR